MLTQCRDTNHTCQSNYITRSTFQYNTIQYKIMSIWPGLQYLFSDTLPPLTNQGQTQYTSPYVRSRYKIHRVKQLVIDHGSRPRTQIQRCRSPWDISSPTLIPIFPGSYITLSSPRDTTNLQGK